VKPPPLPPRHQEPEVVVVEEDEPPSTQRHPVIPPPPRVPSEPFALLTRKQPSNAQLMDKLSEIEIVLGKAWASSTEVLHVQRKMARQSDGLSGTVNGRMDIFHRELALLRGGKDSEEKKEPAVPVSARAAHFALGGGKYTVGGTVGLVVLKVLATQWPWLADILKGVGL